MNVAPLRFHFILGDIFEIGPRSKSRNSFDFNRDPQSRHGAAYTGRSGFVWPFHNNKSGNLETTTSKVSLHEKHGSSNASKFRVVGRGGSGSKLRQVSVSNPVVVLETESTPSIRQQPLDQAAAAAAAPFFRPSGRGGLGSLSTSPPTARKQLKPPTTILGMLRGRKRSEVQINEQYKASTPRRSQSVIYLSKQAQRDIAGKYRPFFLIFNFVFFFSFSKFFFSKQTTRTTFLLGPLHSTKDRALPLPKTHILITTTMTVMTEIHISKKYPAGNPTSIASVV